MNTPETITKLSEIAGRLPAVILKLNDEYSNLLNEIEQLEKLPMANATIYMRDNEYLYLIFPTSDGKRERRYVGNDQKKIYDAKLSIERYKTHAELKEKANHIEFKIRRATSELWSIYQSLNPSPLKQLHF
jgi:hypothetical protein